MTPEIMQPTDKVGQFIREQTPSVVLARALPACMHNPLRSSETGYQPSNVGGVYDDECLQGTPVLWNYGHARSRADGYLDRSGAGYFGIERRIPAHGELDDPNAPPIDTGYSPRIHDRIRRNPGLFERILNRLKFWPDPDPYEIPEYLRHQKD